MKAQSNEVYECRGCGAPIKSYLKSCDYCGREYPLSRDYDMDELVHISHYNGVATVDARVRLGNTTTA